MDSLYFKGQIVDAQVEKIEHYGVYVVLSDRTRAYIRRRELSVEGDESPKNIVHEEQVLKARVLELPVHGHLLELSVRAALPDPWTGFAAGRQVRDVVTGKVKRVHKEGLTISVISGVTGFIPREEADTEPILDLAEQYWVGDRVEAEITDLNVESKRLHLSIRKHILTLERMDQIALQLMGEKEPGSARKTVLRPLGQPETGTIESVPISNLTRPLCLLYLAAEAAHAMGIWLDERGVSYEVHPDPKAGTPLPHDLPFACILLDVGCAPQESHWEVKHYLEKWPQTALAVLGTPQEIEENMHEIEDFCQASVLVKPFNSEDFSDFLEQLANGVKRPKGFSNERVSLAEKKPFQKLASSMRCLQPLSERFQMGLDWVKKTTRADAAVVFELDPFSNKVTIPAYKSDGPISLHELERLSESPVKDVIAEDFLLFENHVHSDQSGRFQNLLLLLDFKACIGVPIRAAGEIEYAIFVFNEDKDAFNEHDQRDVHALATLFSSAIENNILQERISAMSGILLDGQLAASFEHEIYNQLFALMFQAANLQKLTGHKNEEILTRPGLSRLEQRVGDLVEMVSNMKTTTERFRMTVVRKTEGTVDINNLLHQSERMVSLFAKRAQVQIRFHLEEGLPFIQANETGLFQVFLNVMLNAIQQMSEKQGKRRFLDISTKVKKTESGRTIQIRFNDTGPGIHRRIWDKIFAMGFSTRPGGSGLGLFISRSLMESMGGKIQVEDSHILLGTTFLVEI